MIPTLAIGSDRKLRTDARDVDAEVESWLAEAYSVGEQKHLSAKHR
jgi:hypothetical protein